jgi:bifunctional DNA-binding transcriptional regulator/antitoxin component of YhaV-PrlF toxin-antitoxin module
MKLVIDADGRVRLPEELLERWGISPGRRVEARVEKGNLVLKPLAIEGDPFAAAAKGPADNALEEAMQRDAEEKARARDAFDKLLREKQDVDVEKEREERDRWR